MKAQTAFAITAIAGTKQFELTPSTIENTVGKFFGIEWEKANGHLRLANGHVVGFETHSGTPTQETGSATYMIISDRNSISAQRPQGIVKVNLKRVNYFRNAGHIIGKPFMKGRKHDPVKALGNVR